MTDLMMLTALRLRQRAARCRALAATANSDGIAVELSALADDYDDDALRLEGRLANSRETAQFGLSP